MIKSLINNWDWRIYCPNKNCDYYADLQLKDLKNFFDKKMNKKIYESNSNYDINIFSDLYDEITCNNCDTFPLYVINNKHEYILDPKKIVPCEKCEKPILLTRLKILKGTKICTTCAKGKEKRAIEKLKEFNDKAFPKSPPIPDHLKICMKCGSDATTRYSLANQQWFIGCSTFPQCWWKYSLPKYLGDGLFEPMTSARHIVDANHSFSIKGSSDELLQAAKVAFKVRDKNTLKEIRIEMDDRKKSRKEKGKPENNLLNRYLSAVIELEKKINE